jgi:hypothetical protein
VSLLLELPWIPVIVITAIIYHPLNDPLGLIISQLGIPCLLGLGGPVIDRVLGPRLRGSVRASPFIRASFHSEASFRSGSTKHNRGNWLTSALLLISNCFLPPTMIPCPIVARGLSSHHHLHQLSPHVYLNCLLSSHWLFPPPESSETSTPFVSNKISMRCVCWSPEFGSPHQKRSVSVRVSEVKGKSSLTWLQLSSE